MIGRLFQPQTLSGGATLLNNWAGLHELDALGVVKGPIDVFGMASPAVSTKTDEAGRAAAIHRRAVRVGPHLDPLEAELIGALPDDVQEVTERCFAKITEAIVSQELRFRAMYGQQRANEAHRLAERWQSASADMQDLAKLLSAREYTQTEMDDLLFKSRFVGAMLVNLMQDTISADLFGKEALLDAVVVDRYGRKTAAALLKAHAPEASVWRLNTSVKHDVSLEIEDPTSEASEEKWVPRLSIARQHEPHEFHNTVTLGRRVTAYLAYEIERSIETLEATHDPRFDQLIVAYRTIHQWLCEEIVFY
ncbi:MAG: hypothetical protein HQM16_08390 [Deltaproteobacteria bacterium]|nr:hypothetical protein [Deltaproteobacteria bacterium]